MIDILLITNKGDVTTDFVVRELQKSKVPFYRLNCEDLLEDIQLSFDFTKNTFILKDVKEKREINLLNINSVYFRRPHLPTFPNSGLSVGEVTFIRNEINSLLEGLYKILKNAFWISKVYSIREAESKIHQLIVAKELGFEIPISKVTNSDEVATDFIKKNVSIIKPLKAGLIENEVDSEIIFTSKIDNEFVQGLQYCPSIFQANIPKKADIRVTVVGNKIFAAAIQSQEFSETSIDWRAENKNLKYERIILPKSIETLCFKLTQYLDLNFGAIDFVLDDSGNFIFLEINPNGQWAWIEKQLNYPIAQEITNLLCVGKT